MANIKPITLSIRDIPLPILKVEAIRAIDITNEEATGAFVPQVIWEKASDATGNLIIIKDLAGLVPGRKYKITFLLSA